MFEARAPWDESTYRREISQSVLPRQNPRVRRGAWQPRARPGDRVGVVGLTGTLQGKQRVARGKAPSSDQPHRRCLCSGRGVKVSLFDHSQVLLTEPVERRLLRRQVRLDTPG